MCAAQRQLCLARRRIDGGMPGGKAGPDFVELHYTASRHRLLFPGLEPAIPEKAARALARVQPVRHTGIAMSNHRAEAAVRVDEGLGVADAGLPVLIVRRLPPGIDEL